MPRLRVRRSPLGAPRPGDEPDEVDGARAAGDGGEGGQGVLDAEVGKVVLDVGAQHVAVAGVSQPGEVVDGVVGADARPVGEGAGGHGEVGLVGDRVDDRALDDRSRMEGVCGRGPPRRCPWGCRSSGADRARRFLSAGTRRAR